MIKGENILAFSKEWKGDWTSNHHVIALLAEKNKVLWVNSIGVRSPDLSSGNDIKRMFRKFILLFQGAKKERENLYIFTPVVWPFQKPKVLRKLSYWVLLIQLRCLLKKLKMTDIQLWTFLPNAEQFIGKFKEKVSIYYCTDYWKKFPYLNGADVSVQEEKLLKKVDIVFATSQYLYEDKKRHNTRTHIITHGVNRIFMTPNRFAKIPDDIIDIPKPILGFYGWLRDTIDQDLVSKISSKYSDCSIVFIGKTTGNFESIKALPNVYFLGQKPYSELPVYVENFDVGIIPYKMDPELMRATNPIKLKEYFAIGVPVVTTDMTEVVPYRNVCWVSHSHDEFVEHIAEALKPEGRVRSELAREQVQRETWENKIKDISDKIVLY